MTGLTMANEVASVAFRSMIDSYLAVCRRRGKAPTNLCNGLPFDHETADATPYRDWHDWAIFVANIDVAIRSLCTLEELQHEWSQHTPSLGPFRKVLSLFVSPEQVVKAVWVWSGPRMFRPVLATFKNEGRGIVQLGLQLPSSYAPSSTYFKFSSVATRQLPTLLGLPAADVIEERCTDHSLFMILKLPASRSILSRLVRLFKRSDSRHKLSEALLDSHIEHRRDQATLETLVQESRDGVLIERNGSFVTINRAARQIVGIGHNDEIAAGVNEQLTMSGHDHLGTGVGQRLIRLKPGSDAERWVQVWQTDNPDDSSRNSRITFVRDVTDSEAVRGQIERLQRYASIGESGAILGHEITTALAAILSDLQWCTEDPKAGVIAPQTIQTLERTQQNARHIVNVARNLLSPARHDAAAAANHEIGPLVRQAADMASYVAKDSGVHIHSGFPDAPVFSYCRASDVIQITVNLLNNAIQAARHSERKEIHIYLLGAPCRIEVHDFGAGLPPDLELAWGEIQSTRRAGGHGLGLLVSKRLAGRNAATLTYERLAHGTTIFSLSMPPPQS